MATNFPTSLDTFTNPNSGNTLDSPSHSVQHSDINDAVEAIEAKLGVGSSTAGSATAGYALVNTSGGTTAYSLLGVTGLSSGTAVANTVLTANGSGGATFASTAQGLTLLIPSSVAVGSGTGTVSATGTVTFSGASSVSVNDVFSTNYTNYRLMINITDASADDFALTIKFRLAGTDTSTNYVSQRLYAYTTVVGTDPNVHGTDEIWISLGDKDFDYTGVSVDIYNPNVALPTSLTAIATASNGANNYLTFAGGYNSSATQFDGLTLITSAGTISGSVSVYGYNK